MITAQQIRAARALLKWRAKDLAGHTGLTLRTIQRFESEFGVPDSRTKNLMIVRLVLERAGVDFIDQTEESGPGVKLSDPL